MIEPLQALVQLRKAVFHPVMAYDLGKGGRRPACVHNMLYFFTESTIANQNFNVPS